MFKSLIKGSFFFLMAFGGAAAMQEEQDVRLLNKTLNSFTEKMALHAHLNSPNENTLVSGIGPALQLLTTAACLCHTDDLESTESKIKQEIFEGFSLFPDVTTQTTNNILAESSVLLKNKAVTHVHLLVLPTSKAVEVARKNTCGQVLLTMVGDLSNSEKTLENINKFASRFTNGHITDIAEIADFEGGPTANVFLSSLFFSTKWAQSNAFRKTILKFEKNGESKFVEGLWGQQKVYVYDSPKDIDNPFKIINLVGENDLYLALKIHDNGSVSPITVNEFDFTTTLCSAQLKIPAFNFEKGLDLRFLAETFPTLFSNSYQTILTPDSVTLGTFKQKNFIVVDDAGFKGGSITMKRELSFCSSPEPEIVLDINTPFSFLVFQRIVENQLKGGSFIHLMSGTILDLPVVKLSYDNVSQYRDILEWDCDVYERLIYKLEKEKASPEEIEKITSKLNAVQTEMGEARDINI